MPPNSILLASSGSSDVEAMLTGENIISFQGHPEFDLEECILTKIWPSCVCRLSQADVVEARSSFELPLHSEFILQILRAFLKQ